MSNNIQLFSMNRCTAVEVLDETTLRSTCRLQDTFTTASVEILVRLPNLDISAINGQFRHEWYEVPDVAGVLQKLVGTRVGAGMLKIIKGLVGGGEELSQLTYMVEECCHGVILSLTKDILQKAPVDDDGKIEFFANMVKDNIRLYNRCAAFAPGTRLTQNIEPPA